LSKLVVIPTPIGNLEDVTERIKNALAGCDFLLVEDTRHTGKLLNLLGLKAKMKSYHKFNEHKMLEKFVQIIKQSSLTGLVSDAGTPGISDPGFLIVRECIKEGIEVECLPGPTAFVPALILSGFASDRFCFEGFLPQKKGRKTRIELLAEEERTLIFYESPYRIGKTLKDLSLDFGEERQASVSRELTKKFEETLRGSLSELAARFSEQKAQGEFVLVVEGKKQIK
jgi:16S rRNA (cytidine1402-2'-O)-methyltransferase